MSAAVLDLPAVEPVAVAPLPTPSLASVESASSLSARPSSVTETPVVEAVRSTGLETTPAALATTTTEAQVAALLSELTLLEKAALVTGKSVWETYDVPRLGIRSVWLADGPHGLRKQVGSADHLGLNASQPATCFPTAAGVASTWDVELAQQVGAAIGLEAAAQEVDVVLGPGLNIKRSPLGGRNFEYFSEDPLLSGAMAAAYVNGIQSQGVAACPKHYAVNSQETFRMVSDSVVDERTMREIYLTGFEIAVRDGAPRTIMSAYNLVNGTYANENKHLLGDILRDEFGFDGAVVTDWGGSNDVVAGVAAGSSLEMPKAGLASARQLVAAVQAGEFAEGDLHARAGEVLRLALEARQPGTEPKVDFDAHHAFARHVAARSAVLLKNDDGILPLAPHTKVAIIGDFAANPRYQGAGSSVVNPTRVDSFVSVVSAAAGDADGAANLAILDGAANAGNSDDVDSAANLASAQDGSLDVVGYAQGFHRNGTPDPALRDAAVQLAREADVALLFLGLDEVVESEGVERKTLSLDPAQVELLAAVAAANPHVVVVLAGGGVVEMPWLADCQALIHGYLGGQAGAGGILDVLTGKVNPSARLAETVPVSLADSPTANLFPSRGKTAEYREGLYVGYRYYTSAGEPVTFPFGYGLSYTTFAYRDLVASYDSASVTVTNTGAVAGTDVVQVYVSRVSPGVHRPLRTLAGFARVELAPGESRTFTVPLGAAAFRHWDTATNAWQVEAGDWEVLAGANVADLPCTAIVSVAGTVPARTEDLPDCYRTGFVHDVSETDFEALLGRELPGSDWIGPVGVNDPVARLETARSPLARLIYRAMMWRLHSTERQGKPDLNILFQLNMPLRAVGKMTNGLVDSAMVDGLVQVVNGHCASGLAAVVRGFVANQRANKATEAQLRADLGG